MQLLLCTNGSRDGRVAMRIGAQLSIALKLPVTVLGIVDRAGRRAVVEAQVDETTSNLARAGIDAEIRMCTGNPRQLIVDQARGGDYLTAVGSMDIPLWRRMLLGPTVRYLMHVLDGPVLCVYKAREPSAMRHMLICSGGLSQADAAVHLGGRISAAFGATVTLLHIATSLPGMPAPLRDDPASAAEYLQGDTLYARNLQETMAYLRDLGVPAEFRLRSGDPLIEILAEVRSEDYDMVVIGSHTAITGPAYYVGDITHRIVEGARKPVLVVKNHKSQPH